MPFTLPTLPYNEDALAPYISDQTMSFHYGKHHKAYVDNLNKLIEGKPQENLSLDAIIKESAGKDDQVGIFNNAAQVWNHTFFWNSMSPKGGGKPKGDLLDQIAETFGGFDKFKEEFKNAAVTQFGSGWAWLVLDKGQLKITKTPNAVNPMVQGQKALLTCDVWEHAYYLDYQNRRPDFVQAFLDNLVNWEFVEANMHS